MPKLPSQIRVLTGGPFHPSAAQFALIQKELGSTAEVRCIDGAACLDQIDDCDLLIIAGLHWTGLGDGTATWLSWPEGIERCAYVSPTEAQRAAFIHYVRSGRPILNFHGGIACFDDWPEFGKLLGFRWDWKLTSHSPVGEWTIKVESHGHPVVAGVTEYTLTDELYYNVQVTPGMPLQVHAWASYHDIRFPMIITAEGGRIEGAGKTIYLANGHDLRAMECPAFRAIIVNSIQSLLCQ